MLYKVMLDILSMKHFSGSYSDSEHEKNVEDILKKYGFNLRKMRLTNSEKDRALETNDIPSLNNFEYLYQPCGKNNNPDFIVKYNDKLYFLECKSVENSSNPMYNSGLPKDKYIYIFSSKKYNETTLFYGHHVVSQKMRKLYEKYLKLIKSLEKKLTEELENLDTDNPVGISFYVRNMYSHKGKSIKTDYFKHKERKKFEQEVLDSVR